MAVSTAGLPPEMRSAVVTLTRVVERLRQVVVDVVNFNSVTEYNQAAQPTIPSGEFAIWKDSDATTGQPTHYLMYNMGGTTVTFASKELVP